MQQDQEQQAPLQAIKAEPMTSPNVELAVDTLSFPEAAPIEDFGYRFTADQLPPILVGDAVLCNVNGINYRIFHDPVHGLMQSVESSECVPAVEYGNEFGTTIALQDFADVGTSEEQMNYLGTDDNAGSMTGSNTGQSQDGVVSRMMTAEEQRCMSLGGTLATLEDGSQV